jgi:23S rRNA (pseudouridine1915-N3)-methyltransferase
LAIYIISTTNAEKPWVEAVCQDYARRLQAPWNLEFIGVEAQKRKKGRDITSLLTLECEQMQKRCPAGAYRVALDRRGKKYTSEAWAQWLKSHLAHGQPVALFIGGPEGLTEECRHSCDSQMALSDMTFAHPLVRVIVAEQIYRAWSIVHGHPYHR